uniref:Bm14280, isoform c n=1 Tax=Brugia malayi TaxID=6279 RepID=A0A1I9G260_BRUMA|nr:Bm14280, isoform c [Brugia malayi]
MMVWCMWCILKKEEVDDIVRIILETVQDFGNLKVAFKCNFWIAMLKFCLTKV